ncbi:hypothetical protein RJD38_00160 [Vibrio scophthalmi]|uniref:Uncharacterized protein n=1 Tax=Vibrio scophthalmi TaxID=45658 RepID=A0A1B1NNL0_9VIBR|nr:hypothetical protein [Vibrio scophthalmi]ANS85276.1 hypothetical protein VSVS12_01509 [Vibrio scophthalmi]ANU36214.1 hypothetical protein VSVS05_01087 [Vibrio scophthalmi]
MMRLKLVVLLLVQRCGTAFYLARRCILVKDLWQTANWLRGVLLNFTWVVSLTGGIALPAQALDLPAIYQQHLAEKPVGRYEQNGYLFIITQAQCSDESKHAGTAQGKIAEAAFYAQLAEEVQTRTVRIAPHVVAPSTLARLAEQALIRAEVSSVNIRHQKVADVRLPNCIKRQVRAVAINSFVSQPTLFSAAQVEQKAGELLVAMLQQHQYSQLMTVFSEPSEFSVLYQLFELLSASNSRTWQAPNQIEQMRDSYDINGVLAAVKSYQGILYANVLSTNKLAADTFYQQANSLFKQGVNPELIEQKLSLSLNADPHHTQSWKLLSSLFRAINPDEAVYAAKQYFIHSEASLSAWVSLFKALEPSSPAQAQAIQILMRYVAQSTELTAWEIKQIKG